MHWTPVGVALHVARLFSLDQTRAPVVLDIGSGVGKFCIIAGAALPSGHLYGVEHRQHLVSIAEDVADRIGVDNVSFFRGDFRSHPCCLDTQSLHEMNAIYIFNPFAENVSDVEDRIDATVTHNSRRFNEDLDALDDLLRRARKGTRVISYCGFGGDFPREYDELISGNHGGLLRMAVKRI